MDNQSKRIADLVVELLGAIRVELTPTGLRAEQIVEFIDNALEPVKEEVRDHYIAFDNFSEVTSEKVKQCVEEIADLDSKVDDLDSRIDELENADDDSDIEEAVGQYFRGSEFRRDLQELASEAIDDYDFSEKVSEAVQDAIREDDELESVIRSVVRDEIKNALQVLVAHWADN